MAELPVTPRIDARHLSSFTNGQTVRVTGKVTDIRGDTATLQANGPVTLQLTRDSHVQLNHTFEVIGKVNPDLSVRVLLCTDFGLNFDIQAMEAVVDATHRYKHIFYTADA